MWWAILLLLLWAPGAEALTCNVLTTECSVAGGSVTAWSNCQTTTLSGTNVTLSASGNVTVRGASVPAYGLFRNTADVTASGTLGSLSMQISVGAYAPFLMSDNARIEVPKAGLYEVTLRVFAYGGDYGALSGASLALVSTADEATYVCTAQTQTRGDTVCERTCYLWVPSDGSRYMLKTQLIAGANPPTMCRSTLSSGQGCFVSFQRLIS